MSKETIHNRIFKVNLPPYIYNSKSRRNTEDHMSNKRTKRDTVRNRKLNQSGKYVLAKDTLKYHPSIFHLSCCNDIPICCKIQVTGTCKSNCPYNQNKIEQHTPLHTSFSTFVSKCRHGKEIEGQDTRITIFAGYLFSTQFQTTESPTSDITTLPHTPLDNISEPPTM